MAKGIQEETGKQIEAATLAEEALKRAMAHIEVAGRAGNDI